MRRTWSALLALLAVVALGYAGWRLTTEVGLIEAPIPRKPFRIGSWRGAGVTEHRESRYEMVLDATARIV